jgi:myo-inositol-1(or 4)-monophosphatase
MPAAPDIAALLSFADELADAARAVILPYFRTELAVEAKHGPKPGYDPVTEADKGAERAMRALIAQRYPDHGILGEEYGHKPAQSGYTWILDPVDGTRQFIAGLPLWGTLIGLAHEDKAIIGVIDQPYIGERFRGFPGGADFKRDGAARTPIRVRECPTLREATATTTDDHLFSGAEAGAFEHVRATARITRFGGDCYGYAMVAAGGVDIAVESGLAAWDIAALAPVVEGAGGAFLDWRGAPVCQGDWVRPEPRFQVMAVGDMRVANEALVSLRRAAR